MRKSNSPKISIGLPVFDGERYLDGAVESIVSQTFPDFELLIADNCSTDASLAIARKWQQLDPRIRVFESATNLGAAPNFNRMFPHWRLLREYGMAVARSEMSSRQAAQCCLHLLRWIRWGAWRNLSDDLR